VLVAVRSQVACAPCLHARPIKVMYYDHPKCLVSDATSTLDAFRSYPLSAWLPGNAKLTTGPLEAPEPRSSRIKGSLSSDTNTPSSCYRTVSRRTELSSCRFLMDEQSNPWWLLHHQDNLSPYRCIKRRGRCERSPATNRLPPE
jgi:hypothetical protein